MINVRILLNPITTFYGLLINRNPCLRADRTAHKGTDRQNCRPLGTSSPIPCRAMTQQSEGRFSTRYFQTDAATLPRQRADFSFADRQQDLLSGGRPAKTFVRQARLPQNPLTMDDAINHNSEQFRELLRTIDDGTNKLETIDQS
jgi:hypothetical protein